MEPKNDWKYDEDLISSSAVGISYHVGDMEMARKRDTRQGIVFGLALFAGGGTILMFVCVNVISRYFGG
jgi:hypothetical protein